jgi:arylsulfatase A-like enzyme
MKLVALASSWLALTACLSAQSSGRPPNVVYVMADELGYYELSCMGHPHIETPNLDRMAADGMRFNQYLAGSSVCAPTRACLMTGKHSGHTSVRSNGGGTPLREEEATVASVLKERGYATGGFGKWGCGGRGSTGVPELHGFDTFVGYYDQVHAHSYYPAYLVENSAELQLSGNQGGREGETYAHYVIFERAMQFVREHKDAPFFCYLPITPPHGMFDIPDEDPAWARYRDREWPLEARRYAAMVTMVDRQVGELLALLRELGLDEDTVVMFSGDNGGADYFRDQAHPRGFHEANVDPVSGVEFRGKKGQLYEGGLRVPMIVRWPGKVAAGAVSDHLCYFPDMLPTVAQIAGAAPPADIDGVSFAPELLGEDQPEHGHLYWELGNQVAVRQARWKLIRAGKRGEWQLYDLSADVSEARDVAAQHPGVVERLAALAAASHEPVQEGTFARRDLHEADRRAKWGKKAPPRRRAGKVHALRREGLLARAEFSVVRVSSESSFNGKLAKNAIDGDPRTVWHTKWQGGVEAHPHELVIDLGRRAEIRGFALLARQDGGWNGAIARCELAVSDDAARFGAAVVTAELQKIKQPQRVACAPVTGRYVRLRALSEVGGGPWASLAELGVVGAFVE